MNKTQLSITSVFLPLIWSPMIPIHYIQLEDIKWTNWDDPQDMYSLQYPSLKDWKIVESENLSNSNLSYNIE
jgi:hypothetical protein